MYSINNIHFIINFHIKSLKLKDIKNIIDNEKLNKNSYIKVCDEFDLILEEIEKETLKIIDNNNLPGIINYKNEEFIILKKTKIELIILNLKTNEKTILKIKEIKNQDIKYIYIFMKEKEKENLYKNKRWLYQVIKKETKDLSKIVYITFFITLFVFLTPLYIMSIYDRVIPTSGYETLYVLTFGIFVLMCFNYSFNVIKNNFLIKIDNNVSKALEKILYKKLLNLSPETDKSTVSHKLIIFKEIKIIKDFFISNVINIVLELPIFIFGVILISILSKTLWLIPIFITIVILFANLKNQKKIDIEYEKMTKVDENKISKLIEDINLKNDINQKDLTEEYLLKYMRVVNDSENITKGMKKIYQDFGFFQQLMLQLTTILFVFVGTLEIINLQMSVGYLIAFIILSNRMMQPIISMSTNFLKYNEVKQSMENIDSFLSLPEYNENTKKIEINKAPTVYLKDLSFKYNKNTIFNNLNLNIKEKDNVLLIGPNGSGKSTLLKLIIGNLTPTYGEIQINNIDVNKVSLSDYSKQINSLLNTTKIKKGTFLENILLGTNYTEENFEKRIEELKLGFLIGEDKSILQHYIDEDGSNISNGEKQLIYLIRTFLNDSKFILLDEPLIYLIPETKEKLIKYIKEYSKDKTLIIATNDPHIYFEHKVFNRLFRLEEYKVIELFKK